MNHKKLLIKCCLALVILIIFSLPVLAQVNCSRTTVILSLDGFRWDYPSEKNTPVLNRIASQGVKAVSLIPSFPSKTFPNHYTIATGLVPDHHGLVNNSFYDCLLEKSYSITNTDARFNPEFYGGEPIWITAQKQGLHTASFYWVGSDVAIQGAHPDFWKMYNEEVPFVARIDTILKWLQLPIEIRPKLILAYYHEPDGVGHEFGPEHPNTISMVYELDSLTGILFDRIEQLPDGDSINFIVVSDHGMGYITSLRNNAIRDFIPENWPVHIEGGNPNFNFYAKGCWSDSTYQALKKVTGLKVWKPGEVPVYLNYGKNSRVGDIIAVADSGWSLTLFHPKKEFTGGTHGYDTKNTDIHAIFYATGPSFKKGYIQPSFQNTHIYSLLAYLLGIKPAETDGSLETIIDMLK